MQYSASIYSKHTGHLLMRFSVEGHDLREAERAAIFRAASKSNAHPRDIDVRHIHQCAVREAPAAAN